VEDAPIGERPHVFGECSNRCNRTALTLTAEAQSAQRDKWKHRCALGVAAVHVSYSTFKWRTPLREIHPGSEYDSALCWLW